MRGTVRRGWVFGAAVLIAVVAAPRAESIPTAAPASGGDGALVLAADAALSQALRNADKSSARRLLSLEFSYVDQDGKIHERKEFLGDLKAAAAAPVGDPQVETYGRIAMVTGHRKTVHDNDVFFLDIWAKQKGAWRALAMQDVALAVDAPQNQNQNQSPAAAPAKPYQCSNPCQTIPYRVRSPTEQDIINSFQALDKATVAHDADEWSKHVADQFVLYRSGRAPIAKSDRIATIERQKQSNAGVAVGEVQAMRLTAYDNGAAMTASHVMPDNSRPPYRAARVWVRRNGQWQMVISVQTDVK
jgi:hypothetical protein